MHKTKLKVALCSTFTPEQNLVFAPLLPIYVFSAHRPSNHHHTPQITGSKAEDLFRHLATFYANKPIPADTLSEKSILIRWLGLTT